MLGFIKSVGSKAISSIPGFTSRTKIITPADPNLEQKLKEISTQILKAQSGQQFKVYQQLQSVENADFNRNLRKIYQYEGCTTETINCIIRFYTFLLTNCKNELVICKLVSEPLVIELTKIVLQNGGKEQMDNEEQQIKAMDCLRMQGKNNDKIEEKRPQTQPQNEREFHTQQSAVEIQINSQSPTGNQSPTRNQTSSKCTSPQDSLHYLNEIDWDEVNAYKVALIRSYINCINPETIKYMIIDNELPIFVNCVNGYKHYLSEGVEGTCLSNCILMILTKVNHNDEVCEIIFDQQHRLTSRGESMKQQSLEFNLDRQKLAKSISNEKSIKLHIFVKQVITKISIQLIKVLESLSIQLEKVQTSFVERNLKQFRKLEIGMEFIESNILFCVDLINSINNYNYTTKIKQNIGQSIENQLIGKIIAFVSNIKEILVSGNDQKQKISQNQEKSVQKCFQLTVLKLIKFVLNLSIACQKELMMIEFLNKKSPLILQNLIDLNRQVFNLKDTSTETESQSQSLQVTESKPITAQIHSKQCLSYMCDFTLILLKQTISPYSKLASRKRLEISNEILKLKENLLSKIFILLQQLTKSEQLKEGVCFKTIRNLLLCVFYLTIKEDKCSLSSSTSAIQRNKLSPSKSQIFPSKSQVSPQKNQVSADQPNLGLILEFKYSILVLHKIFSEQFKKIFSDNKNWQFIVNNYEALMREVPNNILSPEQSDKHCHFHNGHNYPEQDHIRDKIMICQAVRNYRYMIIHNTKLQDRLIRLQNIYHKHFMSPGWNYHPGQTIQFSSPEEFKIVCVGLLHNNSQQKLPIEIIQDFQCLLISHKISQNNYKLIANIRYKKIHSFVPEAKNLIRMKLIGIQELILQFSSNKALTTFKDYLNENRNKTREKQLKFINYYLNMYLKDSSRLIEEIYNQDLVGLDNRDSYHQSEQFGSGLKSEDLDGTPSKKLSFQNIEVESFHLIQKDSIPEHGTNNRQTPQKLKSQQQMKPAQNQSSQQQQFQVQIKLNEQVQTNQSIYTLGQIQPQTRTSQFTADHQPSQPNEKTI